MPDLSSYNTGSPIYSKQLHISRGNRSKGVEEEGGEVNASFLSCIGN